MARSSRAPQPRYMMNIEPEILVARGKSNRPSASPMSQWGTRWWSA